MPMSRYLEQKIFEHFFRAGAAAAVPQSGALTVSLHTADPGDITGTTSEVSGGAYVRTAASFAAPVAGAQGTTISNSAQFQFPVATANWGTITHASVWDGTNFLFAGPLVVAGTPTPQIVNTNGQLTYPAGQFTIKLD